MKGEVVRLGDMLEFFNKGGEVSGLGPPIFFLFERVHLLKKGHVS